MQANKQLMDALLATHQRVEELKQMLQSATFDVNHFTQFNKELHKLEPIAEIYCNLQKMISEHEQLVDSFKKETDNEMKEMLSAEIKKIDIDFYKLEEQGQALLLPKDPNDEKNIIVEMRPAAGGDEAAIFTGDLFNVYKRYAESQKWNLKITEAKLSDKGGFDLLIFSVSGKNVYSKMKFESGVHRVQRIPSTESKGRTHTSTITVVVLPEMDELEVKIDPKDVRIDVMRASGAGGQSVNKTESAVRLTHMPSGIVVYSQEEKSQNDNKVQAYRVLRARLWEKMENEQQQKMSTMRKAQIGSGDRSEKIRTYNYPQNRFTDHRINLTLNNLSSIMEGNIEQIIEAMQSAEQKNLLEQIKEVNK